MHLSVELAEAIEREVGECDWRALGRAVSSLSDRYRAQSAGSLTSIERIAYLAVRMPATWAAVRSVLSELQRRAPDADLRSLLDLGAGPGAGAWAAAEVFPGLAEITCYERDREFIAVGRRLEPAGGCAIRWVEGDLRDRGALPQADVVLLSYAAGEVEDPAPLINRAWAAARQALVVIEPGTPAGFERIRSIRARLIEAGAAIAAPCPHAMECPVVTPDWCHFAARLERSSMHRRLKGGDLSYEDEKFSYVMACRGVAVPAEARIVRHPWTEPGLVRLELCTPDGLKTSAVRKRDKDSFRRARKAGWGDEWK